MCACVRACVRVCVFQGFKISHFYGSFSNDITAVKASIVCVLCTSAKISARGCPSGGS